MEVVCNHCGALKFDGETPEMFCNFFMNIMHACVQVRQFETTLERVPNYEYKAVIKADERPAGTYEHTFNAATIDEVAILIVGENLETR
ncbi:unnamed protein product [Euphydryas editha]|uniref:Uncharacterized protein n=1 Tax=Euphydryas editha TaxID=104508 RepID=A0AAU9UVN2_EUPED|nr:unnamed protein product [Euphydryas editha]